MATTVEEITYAEIDQAIYKTCLEYSLKYIEGETGEADNWKWEEFGLTDSSSIDEKLAKCLAKHEKGTNFVAKIDGYIVEYHEGRLEKTADIFQMGVGVARPDEGGSYSWNYSSDYITAFFGYLKTKAAKCSCWSPVNSSMTKYFETVKDAGHITYSIDDEKPTIEGAVYNKFIIES